MTMTDPANEAPAGPHEVMQQLAQDVHTATVPPPKSIAKWVGVLAGVVIVNAILTTTAIFQIQTQRAEAHRNQVAVNVKNAAQVSANTRLAHQLKAEQDAIPGQVDARLCAIVNALTPPKKMHDPDTIRLKAQIHCR